MSNTASINICFPLTAGVHHMLISVDNFLRRAETCRPFDSLCERVLLQLKPARRHDLLLFVCKSREQQSMCLMLISEQTED